MVRSSARVLSQGEQNTKVAVPRSSTTVGERNEGNLLQNI